MFSKKIEARFGREATVVELPFEYNLYDTLECGQCFRFVRLSPNENGEENAIIKKKQDAFASCFFTVSDVIPLQQKPLPGVCRAGR